MLQFDERLPGQFEAFEVQAVGRAEGQILVRRLHSVQSRAAVRGDFEQFGSLVRGVRAVAGQIVVDQQIGDALDALPRVAQLRGDRSDRGGFRFDRGQHLVPRDAQSSGAGDAVADRFQDVGEPDDLVHQVVVGVTGLLDSMLSYR